MKIFTCLFVVFLVPLISLAQTPNPQFNWVEQEISPDNNLQGMTVADDGSSVVVGYDCTIKKTTDKGVSWNNVKVFNPHYDCIDMSFNGNTGYIVTARPTYIDFPSKGETDIKINANILKTTNSGETWTNVSLANFGEGDDSSLNPNLVGCYYVDFQSVLCVSDQVALAYARWNDITTSAEKVTRSAIFKTVDGGANWKAISDDLGSLVITSMKKFGDDLYLGGNKLFFKGSVNDYTLVDIYPNLDVDSDDAMYVSDIEFYNSEILVVTMSDGAFVSTDNANTFTKFNGPTGGYDILKYDDSTILIVGSSSKTKATTDGGATWTSCYPGKSCWEIAGVLNDSIICLYKDDLYKMAVSDLVAGNYNWKTNTISDMDENLHKMHIIDESKALIVGYGSSFKITSDKGLTWSDKSVPTYNVVGGEYDFKSLSKGEGVQYASTRRSAIVDFDSNSGRSDLYASGLVLKTTDNWDSWTILNNKNIGVDTDDDPSKYPFIDGCYGLDTYCMEAIDANTAYIYADWFDTISVSLDDKITHSRVFKTSNGGDSWVPVTKDYGTTFIYDIIFKGDTGYIAGNKVLLKTVDGGANFTDIYPNMAVGTDSSLIVQTVKMISSSKEIYVPTTSDGVFYSNDGGDTFTNWGNLDGATDMAILDKNSIMTVGSSAKTKFTNDGGETWDSCYPGTSIWGVGEVLNDSLYVLCKSSFYKIAISDLDISTYVNPNISEGSIRVLYGDSEIKLVSSNADITTSYLYNIAGKLVDIREPRSKVCRYNSSDFVPGIYIISAQIGKSKVVQKVVFK